MTLRHATAADLPAIVAIFNATIPSRRVSATLDPGTVEERRAWFEGHSDDSYPLWLIERESGGVAAWLSLQSFLPRCAYRGTAEVSVYVGEKFRRQGFAGQLLQRAIEYAPAIGTTALLGHIFAHNEPSLKFFKRAGFARWGYLPRVAKLDGAERDLVIVGRHLVA